MSALCASLKPISHGFPANLIEVKGAAPVPPSPPEIIILSAYALVTPAAIVPTPMVETSFTATRALGFTCLQSKINCAKSSIE